MIDEVRRGEVVVSIRPSANGSVPTHTATSVTLVHPQEHRRDTFQLDRVLRVGTDVPNHTNNLWNAVQPLAEAIVAGRNACLIAFGQTGTGKTSSLFGSARNETSSSETSSIVSQMLAHIIQALPSNGAIVDTAVTVSCAEIYNEKVRDLFDGSTSFTDRKVRFHPELGTYIEGLTRRSLFTPQDSVDLIQLARTARNSTQRGDVVNRSHLMIQVQVRRRDLERGIQRNSTLSLVDCGGSERLPLKPNEPQKNVHLSLSMLRRVVDLLVQGSAKRDSSSKKIFNLKDSVLTHALTESLSGNARLMVLATISSDAADYEDSLATLTFAAKFMQIPITARVNEESCNVVVHAIQQEMAAMQTRLQDASKLERNEDLARLQSELASKAEVLQEERAEKAKRQDELHAQVQSTQQELSTIQSVLESKQLAAARAERLNDELARLVVARDVARQRLAQEEALQKQAEMRIAEAKLMELEINNLREERVQLEEKARKEQQAQSMKMMRNIFVVATQLGKERKELKRTKTGIELNVRRVDQLRRLLDAEEHRQYVMDAVVATYSQQHDSLQELHDRFEHNLARLAAAMTEQDAATREAIRVLRDAASEQRRSKGLLEQSILSATLQRMDTNIREAMEESLKSLAEQVTSLDETLASVRREEEQSYHESNELRRKIHMQNQFVAVAPSKVRDHARTRRITDSKIESLERSVEQVHLEVSSLQDELAALEQEQAELDSRVAAKTDATQALSPGRTETRADPAQRSQRDFSPSKSPFVAQSEALASSPYTRRFMKSASP